MRSALRKRVIDFATGKEGQRWSVRVNGVVSKVLQAGKWGC